jgi:hypothetical protein
MNLASRIDSLLGRLDSRGVRLWGPGLARATLEREAPDPARPLHLYVCFADHFEPRWRKPSLDLERQRVARWVDEYPALAQRHRDSFGRSPVRTLFFPVEEYRPEHLDAITTRVRDGLFDVEVHLHHDDDTADNLRSTLTDFARTLHDAHGLLRKNAETGAIEYAFIHGNWALDNAHPAGLFCGVPNELSVLVETGCYMDMTLPCVPSPAQARMVNTIYYAKGREGVSRAHDTGRPLRVGSQRAEGELLLVPGPLGLHWNSRAKGVVPRIEAAMLEPENPVPLADRVRAWVKYAPALSGAPNHRFIKLHAHGCNGDAPDWFLTAGGPFDQMLGILEREWSDARSVFLHYVTAREMYECIKRLEAGA